MPPLNVREVVWEEESPSEVPVYRIFFDGRWAFIEGRREVRNFSFRPLMTEDFNSLNADSMRQHFFLE